MILLQLKSALDSCAISKQFLKLFSIWKNLLSLVVLARGEEKQFLADGENRARPLSGKLCKKGEQNDKKTSEGKGKTKYKRAKARARVRARARARARAKP